MIRGGVQTSATPPGARSGWDRPGKGSPLRHGGGELEDGRAGSETSEESGFEQGVVESNLALRETLDARTRALNLSESRFRSIIGTTVDGVLIVDREGLVRFANPAAARLLGSSLRSLLGHPFGFPISPEGAIEIDTLSKGAAGRVVEMRVAETEWEGETASVVALRDVTDRRQAQEALEQERTRLALVINEAADAIIVTDQEGVISEWNPAAMRVFGWRRDEAVGRNLREIVGSVTDVDDLLAAGDVHSVYQWPRKGGSTFRAEVAASRVGISGRPAGITAVVRDVTEKVLHEAATSAVTSDLNPEQALKLFAEILFSFIPYEVMTVSAPEEDGSFRRLLGFGPRSEAFDGAGVPVAARVPMQRAIETGRPIVVGDTTSATYEFNEWARGVGITSYAILPLKKDREAFATLNIAFGKESPPAPLSIGLLTSVSDAVAQGVRNILVHERERAAVERLQQVNEMKNEFVAMVVHDMKTPLTVIGGFADTVIQSWDHFTDERKMEILDLIKRKSLDLARMVDDTMQVARIDSGDFSYKIKPFDLAEVVSATVNGLQAASQEAIIATEVPEDLPPVSGDRFRQGQILTNLLSNAIKYSRPPARVTVRVVAREAEVEVSVHDQGKGITQSEMELLFKKYSRLTQGSGGQDYVQGTGLGLYICKRMVEAQGGRIWVESEPGEGSTFHYTVPVAATP